MMPDPSSVQTSVNDNVRLWYSIWNGGRLTSGIPGSTLPVIDLGNCGLLTKLFEINEKVFEFLPDSLNGGEWLSVQL